MSWLMEIDDFWDDFLAWLPFLLALAEIIVLVTFIGWVLMTKSDSISAVAWCLLIIFLPFAGAFLFYLFGYQHVERPLRRKRRHKLLYRSPAPRAGDDASQPPMGTEDGDLDGTTELHRAMHRVACRSGAYPLTLGNRINFYHEGKTAYDAMFEAIEAA